MRPITATPAVLVSLLATTALAACGTSSPSAAPSTHPPMTSPSTVPSTPSAPSASASPATAGAQDLAVTDAIRAQLVAAGAKAKGLTASDFVGLEKGLTYYAYDPATQTYWAGAALKPSTSSMPAEVSTQDDGAYTLFHRAATGAWIAMDSALTGPNGPTGSKPCSVTPPAAVLALWGWPAKSCHPTGA